jgi:hypothetical protein
MKMAAYWQVASCGLVGTDRRFKSIYYRHAYGGSKHLWNVVQFLHTTLHDVPEDTFNLKSHYARIFYIRVSLEKSPLQATSCSTTHDIQCLL